MTGGLVLVVGSANIDLIARVPRLPGPGETVLGALQERTLGGKGLNQALAARRAGAPVDFRAAIGTGPDGDWLVESLRAERVCVDHLERPAGSCGTALVIVDAQGENQIVVDPGSNAQASSRLLSAPAAQPPAVVLAQREIPQETVLAAMRFGRGVGAVTVLNAAPATPLGPEVLDAVDLLVVNEHEYAVALGRPQRAALDSPPPGGPTVVVTMGAAGAVILRAGRRAVAVPAPEVRAVDTVAAGDAFCGVLAACLARGDDLKAAVAWGCAAGALTVTRAGAAAALPTADELRRFVDRT